MWLNQPFFLNKFFGFILGRSGSGVSRVRMSLSIEDAPQRGGPERVIQKILITCIQSSFWLLCSLLQVWVALAGRYSGNPNIVHYTYQKIVEFGLFRGPENQPKIWFWIIYLYKVVFHLPQISQNSNLAVWSTELFAWNGLSWALCYALPSLV